MKYQSAQCKKSAKNANIVPNTKTAQNTINYRTDGQKQFHTQLDNPTKTTAHYTYTPHGKKRNEIRDTPHAK